MTSDRIPLDPDLWVIAYQERGSGAFEWAKAATERAADEMTRRLIARGCVVHAARTQRDTAKALGIRG
jgi:hypothetical protein